MRIILFILTNLAVVALASITLSILGVTSYITSSGLDLYSLFIFALVFGMTGALFSLFISKPMAKRSAGVKLIKSARTEEEKWLLDTIAKLAYQAGIKMPEVGIFPMQAPNAFATGWNKNNALVAVSQGLLNTMQRNEIEAVLGHEIGHVANGDMVTMSLLQGVVNTFVIFLARVVGYLVDSALRGNNNNSENSSVGIGFYITSFVAEIILGIGASAIVMWFSRYREYRADAAGAKFAGKTNMIAALRRLQNAQEAQMPENIAAFGINKSKKESTLANLFSSHPPLEDRIRALQTRG